MEIAGSEVDAAGKRPLAILGFLDMDGAQLVDIVEWHALRFRPCPGPEGESRCGSRKVFLLPPIP